ncbi:Cadherin-related tumor suppressor [Trichinella patagoniensis]|uniref:Cadherin-related tumor suppressor n=1 Tax=Trichinella patagoniensis TaxID=990121 RepID=A0A0V0ZUT4_9BILA|nr:Cadherin-related tumor suppressor [Trichinella patagoniensis]
MFKSLSIESIRLALVSIVCCPYMMKVENRCGGSFRPAEVASGVWLLFTVVVQMADVTFSTTKANNNPQEESNQSWRTALARLASAGVTDWRLFRNRKIKADVAWLPVDFPFKHLSDTKSRMMNGHCLATIFIPLLLGASSFLYLTSSASSSLEERIQLNVTEGVPKNTVVGSITKLDGYQYRLSEPNVHFHFNTDTGEIITAEQIDRENLLDGDSDTIDLVIVSKGVPAYFITVTINVLDVNDNAPKFPLPYQNVSLPESAKIGTQIVLIGANDRDAGINGKIVNYTLIGSDVECCQLLSQNEGSVLLLTLKNPLDREKKDLYILNISATDGGVPPLTGYTTVFLNVLDSNDNPPVFNETEYLVIVNESLPVGKPIFQIQATDLDLGENSRLSYSLVDNQDECFSINSETGLIETTKPLHCNKHYCKTSGECVGECILTVEATDHGLPSQRARAFVRIQVVNTNDHPPEIQIRFYTNNVGGYAIVNNQNPVGSVIALISVTDKDSGINGKTTLNITSGNELGHFRLDNSLGFSLLRTNASLNHREHHWYNLTLKAQDLGLKPRVSLAEDLPVGSKVIALQAHLENKPIFYSILSGNEFGWFHITEKTGLITTAAELDYEFQSEHILIISAKSAALTEDFSTTKVYIQLMDVNDNSPEFFPDSLEASVQEDASIGTHITTIRTTDKDSGMNAVVKLNETTGDLILMKTLNREIQAEYSLDIIATDQGLPQRQTSTTVRIHVLDVNDELPKFYPTKYAVNILKSSAVGSAVATVKARDLDEGSNGLVTYYFEDSPVGIFDLDVNLGKIVLKKIPLGRNSINIVVKAKDADGKTSVNNATVQVNFIDSLYATPKFTQPKYEFVVQEDFGTGPHLARPIGSVSATDFDFGSQLHYEIVDGNDMSLFEIGPYSGEIRSTRTLDFEEQRTHQLKVLAYGQQAVTSVLVSVNLEDVNDNDPKFLNNANIVEITDHTPVGFPILHTRAEDADSGMNGKINYYIVSDLRQAFLSVDSDSGLVTLTRPGHLVNPGQYEFSVHANDNGMPSRNDSTKITVLVKHDNNILESFQNQTLQFIIPEDKAVNEMVSKIGFGQYLHQYFIVDPTPDDLFGVFPDGWIYVKNALDFETTNYEKLSISIQNGKVKSLIEAEFFITDVNDNSPTCLKEIFQFEIAENMPPLSYVGTVEADDPDSKLNGIVRFRLANPEEDRFVLDSETGILRTLVQFDREEIYKMNKKSTIELQIEAYDLAEVHPLSTRCSVFVTVMDENDHRPQFTLDMYSASLLENKDIGSEVLRVSARDEDMNMNSMVKFEIASGNENNTFSLDPYTGKLTLSAPLDREIQAVYRITLRATDHGVPPLSSTAFATIVVTDVNDNAPKFTSQVESILIDEDTELGTCVHHFNAFDLDAAKFGEISYSFSIGQVFGPFYLNPYDGCLMLIQPLDYETAKNYTLVVYASDAGTPKLSSSVVLRVLIKHTRNKMIDIGESLHTEVEENAPVGTEIMKLSPLDMDNEVDNEIHFTILHQFPEVKFQIDHTKGTISICGPLDRETVDEYKLLVQAENAKYPKRSTRQTVTVRVNDVNDQAPEFYSYHAFLLPQSPRAGQFVGKLSVRDADVNNNISLSLLSSDNSDLFSLTEEGDIFVKKPILHPLPFYVLKVKAEDQPIFGSPLTENAEIHLIWNGEERSEFEFEKEVYDFSLAETTPIGTQLKKLHLKNENSSMGIQYFVIGDQANQELFVDVEQNSGILWIVRNLDCNFNSTGQFIITVVAISTQVQNNYEPLIATCKVS